MNQMDILCGALRIVIDQYSFRPSRIKLIPFFESGVIKIKSDGTFWK